MSDSKKAGAALISVFHKDGLEPVVRKLHDLGVALYSTGGTETFIRDLGIPVTAVETITGYPSILGGRVKTLHPKVFGGILGRRHLEGDQEQLTAYEIPALDIVIVDLYPFEKTVAEGASEQDIIEKIDIGGISLIRAAAKNYRDVLCVSSMEDYADLLELLERSGGETTLEEREAFAARAFNTSSHYDSAIFNYFNRKAEIPALKVSHLKGNSLRYGENPHQEGRFYGDFEAMFDQLHGKALSYNNFLDIDAAVNLMSEFRDEAPTFAILKHNNACGLATRPTLVEAYADALAGDPVSAFGGILISNKPIDAATAAKIHDLFCEVVIAPSFEEEALQTLKGKKNRILLVQKHWNLPNSQLRTCLNGILYQERDAKTDAALDLIPCKGLPANQIFTLCTMIAHNLSREIQMLASPPAPRSLPKRPTAWAFERLDTLRHRIIQRAGRLTKPKGELTLTMSANSATQRDLLHFLDVVQKAA